MSGSSVNVELLTDLQCIVLPGREKRCKQEYKQLYNRSYQLWHEVMCDAYRSEGLEQEAQQLASDDFIRNEEFVCLVHDDVPVGLLMFDWMNLDADSTLQLSYFTAYPQEVINHVVHEHQLIMTIGHLVVEPNWRKKHIGPGVAEILTGFMTHRFLQSPATALLITTRNTRSTHRLAHEHGGKSLVTNYQRYGVASDIVIFYRNTVKNSDYPEIVTLTNQFWERQVNAIINPLHTLYSKGADK